MGDGVVENIIKDGDLIQILPDVKFKKLWDILFFYQNYGYDLPKTKSFLDFYCYKIAAK